MGGVDCTCWEEGREENGQGCWKRKWVGWQNEWGVLQMFLGEKRTSSRLHMLHRRREGSGIEGGDLLAGRICRVGKLVGCVAHVAGMEGG